MLYPIVQASVQTSSETLQQLQQIMASINSTVDPCEDFYSYACGNWPEQHKTEKFGIANMMERLYAKDIEDIVAKEYPKSSLDNLEQGNGLAKALRFYYSCLEIKDNFDVVKFVDIIKPANGVEWPLLEEINSLVAGNKSKFRLRQLELFALLGELHSLGLNNELVKAMPLYLESGELVVIFTLPQVEYMEMEHIEGVLKELGVEMESVRKHAVDIFETQSYWQSVYENFTNSQEEGEEDDDGYTLAELRLLYPKLHKFLGKVLPISLRREKPLVGFSSGDYYKFLFSHKWSNHEIGKFCNYLLVKFLMLQKSQHSFGCRVNVLNSMPFAFHSLYYKHHYQPYAQDLNQHISILTKKIYKYFLEILNENPLNFNRKQLQIIEERLANVSINVGNLPQNLNSTVLEDYYGDVPELNINNYYGNHLLIKQHSLVAQLKCPASLSCREDPDHIPYYDRSLNMIVIPFGTLKPPLYDIHHHPLLLYSAFGTILGHELTHAIDPTSLIESNKMFENLTKKSAVSRALTCMEKQEPTSTIDERIADFLGTRVAWNAYNMEHNGTDLTYSDMTWQKLFFLNLSQFFCVKRQDFDDEHDSPPMRLNLIVMNFNERVTTQSLSEDLKQIQRIELSIDGHANPCVNFYEYACGNWSSGHLDDMEYDLESVLRQKHVLDYVELVAQEYPLQEHPGDYKQTFVDKTLAYFYSCIGEFESYDAMKYLEEIKPSPGLEWPLLEVVQQQQRHEPYVAPNVWPVGKFNLFALLGKLSSYGFESGLIEYGWIELSGRRIITISLPELPELERTLVRKLLREMKLPKQVIRKYYLDAVRVHQQLETLYQNYTQNEDSDRTEYEIPYRGLKHDIPHLYNFLSQQHPPSKHSPDSVAFLSDVDYFSKLLAEFRNPQKMQKLCNYLMLNFLIYMKYEQPANCFYAIKNRLHLSFDYLYSKHFYHPQAEDFNSHISLLSTKIYRNLFGLVKENRLDLSKAQVKLLKQHLFNVTSNIGNLPENITFQHLEKIYENLPAMDAENFYANDLKALKHQVWLKYNCPSKVICNSQFPVLPSYDLSTNNVAIPFASLQTPVYHLDLDPILSLSTFGFLLAQSYAKSINLEALQQLSPLFQNLTLHPNVKCMVLQEPTDFINERIADLMGARVAYQSYAHEYKYNLQPQFSAMPWKKLFFLNMAQMFCSKTPEDFVGDDGDSPMTRLNQIAMNLDVFGEAFKCPMGSEMNPARKCRFL
ncbi:uncharacterized protein [Musca autumnalis]|uniref:uncharacterized protein n=1 Tax=Musca autumnalis TaxID=221902 RepID=UPI003CF6EEA8